MFGSDLLDVAIGLILMFFVFAVAASAIVEAVSTLLARRAADLERTIGAMVGNPKEFYETSVFKALKAASGDRNPSYVSAKSFADAAIEYIDAAGAGGNPYDELQDPLKTRVRTIVAEVGSDLTAVKAELENWFDGTMDRLQGAYKRWATARLFIVGLILAVVANASAFHVARDLWNDATLRASVVAAAEQVVEGEGADADAIADVGAAVEGIAGIGLPIGWTGERRAVWSGEDAQETGDGEQSEGVNGAEAIATVGGWLATAVFVMLGGPFWFDLLTKLVALRGAGSKPPRADEDDASASATVRAESTAPRVRALGSVDDTVVLGTTPGTSGAPAAAVEPTVRDSERRSPAMNRYSGRIITRLVEGK